MKKVNNFSSKRKKMAVHSTYEVRWKNFKGFEDTGWIQIKPITILIGANNSGKTSFISPFLLMNQTLASRDYTSPLIFKGNLYDGGNFREIVHNYDESNSIYFGVKYHVHPIVKRPKAVGIYPPGSFEVTIGKDDPSSEIAVISQNICDMFERPYLNISRDSSNDFTIQGGFKFSDQEKEIIKHIKPINFLFSPNSFLYEAEKALEEQRENSTTEDTEKGEEISFKKNLTKGYQDLLKAIAANYSQARNMILDMSYLGPLRDAPRRFYEVGDEVYDTVGLRGENTANLLKLHLAKKRRQVNKWIKRFGFGDKLILEKLYGNLLYSISFKDENSGHPTNIVNTGFGASQVLPLIVQGIVSQKESITIAEQPEIHLNPKLQSVLAELFVEMAKRDQRIIVETHSEHLLLRLRTLIANKSLPVDLIALYYVEKVDGISKIRQIPIDENGRIKANDWPRGFFDEALSQSLALVSAQHANSQN